MEYKVGNKTINLFMSNQGNWRALTLLEGGFGNKARDVGGLYHVSWEWLMPVVIQIESMLPEDIYITIESNRCLIPVINAGGLDQNFDILIEGGTKLEACYEAILEFIEWYEKQKKNG